MRAPRFTVAVPAFNAERTIAAAVGSALAQSVGDLEVIVIDDGSEDGTVDAARAVGDDRVRIVSQPNRGPAAARNAAIEIARGRDVAFLDSDDLWLPHFLERTAAALDRTGQPGFAYTDAYVFQSSSGRVRRQSAMELMRPPVPDSDPDRFLLQLLQRNFIFISTVVPRTVLDAVGGYDESRFATADYELWLRIVSAGYEPAWAPGMNAAYRLRPDQMSANPVAMCRELVEMFAALSVDAMPRPAHRDLLRARRRETERELRIVEGRARIAATLRRARHTAGRARQRMGLSVEWYDEPPDDVAAVLRQFEGWQF